MLIKYTFNIAGKIDIIYAEGLGDALEQYAELEQLDRSYVKAKKAGKGLFTIYWGDCAMGYVSFRRNHNA